MKKLIDEFEDLLRQVNEKADEIMSEVENLKSDNERLQEEYEDLEEDLKENYKPISIYDFNGVSESDF